MITVADQPRRVRLELDLSELEARDLTQAIGEAKDWLLTSSEGGWRSDPTVLLDLEAKLTAWLAASRWPSPTRG
jgi:hypothetical protein